MGIVLIDGAGAVHSKFVPGGTPLTGQYYLGVKHGLCLSCMTMHAVGTVNWLDIDDE